MATDLVAPTALRRDDPVLLYVAAALGTALAGGLFPSVVAAFAMAMSVLSGRIGGHIELHEVVGFLLGGFVVGFCLATAATICIFPVVGVLDWLASLKRWRGMLISCAGGWCGFASVAALTQQARSDGALSLAFLAMAMGQVGAGIGVRRRRNPSADVPHGSAQLPLRQLFGITIAVAIAAAVLAALPITPQTYAAMAFAAACQAAVVSGYLLIRKVRRGSRDDQLPVAPIVDVPRETIGATPLD